MSTTTIKAGPVFGTAFANKSQHHVNTTIDVLLGLPAPVIPAGGPAGAQFPAYTNLGTSAGSLHSILSAIVLGGGATTVEDVLTSTSTTNALSANMGRNMNVALGKAATDEHMGTYTSTASWFAANATAKANIQNIVSALDAGAIAVGGQTSLVGTAPSTGGRPNIATLQGGSNITITRAGDVITIGETTSTGRFRGTWSSADAYPTQADGQRFVGQSIEPGDCWIRSGADANVGGDSEGTTTITSGDKVIAVTSGVPTTGDWTILQQPSTDLNVVQSSITAAAAANNTQNFAGGSQTWTNLQDFRVEAVTGGASSGGNPVWDWTNTRTLIAGGYTTGAKTEAVVGPAVHLLGTTANGEHVQMPLITAGTAVTDEWAFELAADLTAGTEVTLAQLAGKNGTTGNAPTATWATDNNIDTFAGGLLVAKEGGAATSLRGTGTATGISFSVDLFAGNRIVMQRRRVA